MSNIEYNVMKREDGVRFLKDEIGSLEVVLHELCNQIESCGEIKLIQLTDSKIIRNLASKYLMHTRNFVDGFVIHEEAEVREIKAIIDEMRSALDDVRRELYSNVVC